MHVKPLSFHSADAETADQKIEEMPRANHEPWALMLLLG